MLKRLTRSFLEKWRDNFNEHPTPLDIECMIRQSVRVQCGRICHLADGRIYKQLSIYWHPKRQLILKIDSFTQSAVSVIRG